MKTNYLRRQMEQWNDPNTRKPTVSNMSVSKMETNVNKSSDNTIAITHQKPGMMLRASEG